MTAPVNNDKPLTIGAEPRLRSRPQERSQTRLDAAGEGTSRLAEPAAPGPETVDVGRASHLLRAEASRETVSGPLQDPTRARALAGELSP